MKAVFPFFRFNVWFLLIPLLAVYLSGCSLIPAPWDSKSSQGPAIADNTTDKNGNMQADADGDQPSRAKGKLKPMPVKPITMSTSCTFTDGPKYKGKLQADVNASTVKQFKAEVAMADRGVCTFDLGQFKQTETLPIVKLKSLDSACQVFMWTQSSKVTVAFNQCQSQCTGRAHDYLWPIIVNGKDGGCS